MAANPKTANKHQSQTVIDALARARTPSIAIEKPATKAIAYRADQSNSASFEDLFRPVEFYHQDRFSSLFILYDNTSKSA